MEKPIFSNGYSVTKNEIGNEVVIDFLHNYPVSDINAEGQVTIVNARETVFKTVTTVENARALVNALNSILG